MNDHTNVIYTKNKTELLWPIKQDAVCDENEARQQHEDHAIAVYVENEKELSWSIGLGATCDEKPNRTTMWSIVWVWSLCKKTLLN